jgi:hypothetical protein
MQLFFVVCLSSPSAILPRVPNFWHSGKHVALGEYCFSRSAWRHCSGASFFETSTCAFWRASRRADATFAACSLPGAWPSSRTSPLAKFFAARLLLLLLESRQRHGQWAQRVRASGEFGEGKPLEIFVERGPGRGIASWLAGDHDSGSVRREFFFTFLKFQLVSPF